MAEVFAGFVCGYALALIATPVIAIALVRARATSPLVQRAMPEGSSLIAVSVILHGFLFILLTAVGLLLGMLLAGLEERSPAGGLGSPNRVLTAFIIATAAIAVLPLAVALPRARVALVASGIVFAVTFGWVMPYLALLGPDDG
jgi:hypothetical protein